MADCSIRYGSYGDKSSTSSKRSNTANSSKKRKIDESVILASVICCTTGGPIMINSGTYNAEPEKGEHKLTMGNLKKGDEYEVPELSNSASEYGAQDPEKSLDADGLSVDHIFSDSAPKPIENSCWETETQSISNLGGPRNWMETILIDVELTVQATYQREKVPLVSLTSRVNGKSIIGHPIDIEALEDGSSLEAGFVEDRNEVIEFTTQPARSTAGKPLSNLNLPHRAINACQHPGTLALGTKGESLTLVQNLEMPLKRCRFSNQILWKHSLANGQKDRVVEGAKPVTCVPVDLVFNTLHAAVGLKI